VFLLHTYVYVCVFFNYSLIEKVKKNIHLTSDAKTIPLSVRLIVH